VPETDNVWPCVIRPESCGALVKTGAARVLAVTVDEAAIVVATWPFDAVAITVMYLPVSPVAIV
jgi:hypothetical protein